MRKIILGIATFVAFLHISTISVSAGAPLQGCPGGEGIDTAIGCIPLFDGSGDMDPFIRFALRWGIGISGGIGMLLILYAGFQIMTSSGNPQQLQSGKELLGAAVSGILLLIFSAFILRFVGVDILGIFAA